MAGSKAFDFYALSCGSLWQAAWNLIETAQRKSQDPLARFGQVSFHCNQT
jgi:hypothetical protein